MPWIGGAIAGGASLLGGVMQANAAKSAAQESARAQLEASRLAAEAAKFRPVGVTTAFGQSNFQMSPEGYLQSAGYTLTPEMQAYQQGLLGLAQQGLAQAQAAPQAYAPLGTAAQGLFGLGSQYLAQSPEQVAQDYMSKQQALLAPGREQESARLMSQLAATGRTGLQVAQGGNLSMSNPEMQALANARAMQDLQLAAQAQQAGQQQVAFGTGLFGQGAGLLGQMYGGQSAALTPFTTALGGAQTVEGLGQQALDIGSALGAKTSTAGANVGRSLLLGGLGAAQTAQAGNQINPWAGLFSGLGNNQQFATGVGKWLGGGGTAVPNQLNYGGFGTQGTYADPSFWETPGIYDQMAEKFGYT